MSLPAASAAQLKPAVKIEDHAKTKSIMCVEKKTKEGCYNYL